MDIDVLVPRLPDGQRSTHILDYERREESLERRKQQLIFIEGEGIVRGVSRAYLRHLGKETQMGGFEADLLECCMNHEDLMFVSSQLGELMKATKLVSVAALGVYQYLQSAVIYKEDLEVAVHKSFGKGDPRLRAVSLKESKMLAYNTLLNLTLVCLDESDIKEFFLLKRQHPQLSLKILSLKPVLREEPALKTRIYKLSADLLSEFANLISPRNQIYMPPQDQDLIYLYLEVVCLSRQQKEVCIVADQETLNRVRCFVINSLEGVEVRDINDQLQPNPAWTYVLFHVDKAFLRCDIDKDLLVVITRKQEEKSMTQSVSLTSFYEKSPMSSQYVETTLANDLTFPRLCLKNVEFSLGGSYVCCVLNLQNQLISQDMIIMHHKYPYAQLSYVLPDLNKPYYMIKPKSKFPRLLAVVLQELKSEEFSRVVGMAKKERCLGLVFRESDHMDGLQLVQNLSTCQILNDFMLHMVITIDFNKQQRFDRFVKAYLYRSLK